MTPKDKPTTFPSAKWKERKEKTPQNTAIICHAGKSFTLCDFTLQSNFRPKDATPKQLTRESIL